MRKCEKITDYQIHLIHFFQCVACSHFYCLACWQKVWVVQRENAGSSLESTATLYKMQEVKSVSRPPLSTRVQI